MTKLRLALATQVYLPYTQTWIYRQINPEHLELILCNQIENNADFYFKSIVVAPHRSLIWRKLLYKLHFVFKHLPFFISAQKWKIYYTALIRHRINLVHAHFGLMGIQLMDVCEAAKIPLVVTFHGFDITSAVERDPSYKKALKTLFCKVKIAIAVSEEMKKRLIQLGCPSDKIKVSYLGIPVDQFPYEDRTHRLGTVRFIHAGRFTATKGVPDLIEAFSFAFTLADDVELIIVGQGEEIDKVRTAINKSAIKHKIKLKGQQKNSEMFDLLKASDVFVLNSRTSYAGAKEGLPIALLEAASTGLPAISTIHSGIPEAVIDGVTGILVNEYDQKSLSRAMKEMMNKEVRLRLGREARVFMENKFELKKCNKVLTQIYDQATLE